MRNISLILFFKIFTFSFAAGISSVSSGLQLVKRDCGFVLYYFPVFDEDIFNEVSKVSYEELKKFVEIRERKKKKICNHCSYTESEVFSRYKKYYDDNRKRFNVKDIYKDELRMKFAYYMFLSAGSKLQEEIDVKVFLYDGDQKECFIDHEFNSKVKQRTLKNIRDMQSIREKSGFNYSQKEQE